MELQDFPKSPSSRARRNQSSSPAAAPPNETEPQTQPTSAPQPQQAADPHFWETLSLRSFSKWWHAWIARTITHSSTSPSSSSDNDPRDHLALERTFLGWIRTSLALISLAVTLTQLFILHDLDRVKGVVLGCVLTVSGMAIVIGAAVRFFRAQELLVRGKALTGGWEAIGVWGLLVLVIGMLFVVVVVED